MFTKLSNKYCLNCGKYNHNSNCKLPIISLGVIAFRQQTNNDTEYLMVRRKNSYGFIDFMRGKYNIHNDNILCNLIDEMTIHEKYRLQNYSFNENWSYMWGKDIAPGNKYQEKYELLKNGCEINSKHISIDTLINNSKTNWEEPEWGIPKGRRNFQENDLNAAIREWEEETGYNKNDLLIIENLIPFEEIFIGSNNKSYNHKYFVANFIGDKNNIHNFQKSEISDCKWMTYDECINSIRPYDLEKKELFNWVKNVLSEYKRYVII